MPSRQSRQDWEVELDELGTATSWGKAFLLAQAPLAEDRFTALAILPAWKFKEGDYDNDIVILEELGEDPDEVLANQEVLAAAAHGDKEITLYHGKRRIRRREKDVEIWLVAFVF